MRQTLDLMALADRRRAFAVAVRSALTTPDAFRSWLTSLPADETVGLASCYGECPVAEFVRHIGALDPTLMPRVAPYQVVLTWADGDRVSVFAVPLLTAEAETVPEWLHAFVARTDQNVHMAPISAALCLSNLDAAVTA